MWDILDYTSPTTPGPQKTGRGLFDSAFIQDKPSSRIIPRARELHDSSDGNDEHDDDVVETQIFHHPNPATEVDTSNGGQELPPYSGAATRRSRSDHNINRCGSTYGERSTHSAPAEQRHTIDQGNQHQPYGQQEPETLLAWPSEDMWLSASIMDTSHDPFVQFQAHDMPWGGSWEIGNL